MPKKTVEAAVIEVSQNTSSLELENQTKKKKIGLLKRIGAKKTPLADLDQPVNPAKSKPDQPVNPAKSKLDQPVNPAKSKLDQPVNPVKSKSDQPIKSKPDQPVKSKPVPKPRSPIRVRTSNTQLIERETTAKYG